MNLSYKKHAFVLLVSALFCLIQGWESIIRSWDHVNDLGDAFINLWILAWNTHALFDPNSSVWNAPQFYPVENTLAFSEAMFANLFIYIPFYLITENPVFSSNMVGFISFVLCAYCGYLLIEEITGNFWAGLIGGFLFSFSPYRWGHFSHLQLIPFFWAPLAILFTHRFFKTPQPKYFYGIAATTIFQYYHSIYLGAMLTSALLTLFLIHIFLEREKVDRWFYFKDKKLRLHLISGTLFAGLCLGPLGLPYLLIASKWNIVRSFTENIVFSAEPLSFFYPNSFINYEWLRKAIENTIPTGETQVFMGVLPSVLAITGISLLRSKNYANDENFKIILRRYFIAALAMVIIMMGPYFRWLGENTGIPLPYQIVHSIIPGGAAMRAPARFFQLLLLFTAILAGFGIKSLLDWSRTKKILTQSILYIGFGLLFFLDYQVLFYKGIKAELKKDFPPVYKYIAESNPGAPYLELPTKNPSDFRYLLYQTASWRPTLNGKSGWAPPAYWETVSLTKDCPFTTCVKFLEAVQSKTILVHLDQYPDFQRKLWQTIDWSRHGFSSSTVIENSLVLEKKVIIKEGAKEIKINRAYFSKDDHGLLSLLTVQPADNQKNWVNLKPDRSVIKFSIDYLKDGKTLNKIIEKDITPPSYVLSGVPLTIPLTRLEKKIDTIERVHISGDKFQPITMDKSSIVFLDETNTSQNKENNLQGKIIELNGLSTTGVYSPNEKILIRANILNDGKAFWLDQKLNISLRDTENGTVFFAAEWFPEKEMASCIHPKTEPVSARYKTLSNIVAPQEIGNFETLTTTPKKEGNYVLWIGLGSVNVAWFHDIGPSQMKCFHFSVKKNS